MARFMFYQGESQTIELEVYKRDGTPATLIGATVKAFLYKKATATILLYTITDHVVSIHFTPAQTILMYGAYDYEILVEDAFQEIDLKAQDTFFVRATYLASNS